MILLLTACWTVTESHCETSDRVIGDDTVFAFGQSTADVLADLSVTRADAFTLDGQTVALDVTLARADGDIVLADAEVIEEVIRPGGPNTQSTWLSEGDPCVDVVHAPTRVTIGSEDGTVTIDATAELSNDPSSPEEVLVLVDGALGAADSVPVGLHGTRMSGTFHLEYFRRALVELRVEAVAEDGAGETVVWFQDDGSGGD